MGKCAKPRWGEREFGNVSAGCRHGVLPLPAAPDRIQAFHRLKKHQVVSRQLLVMLATQAVQSTSS